MNYVFIDKGHATSTPGKRTPTMPDGSVIHESEFNLPVSLMVHDRLKDHGFFVWHVSEEVDVDTSLSDRVNSANEIFVNTPEMTSGNSCFVSIHYNALDGEFGTNKSGGVETYHYPNSLNGSRLATAIHNEVIQGNSQVNKGIKTAEFYVLRKTKMPASLIEFGFMDYLPEAELMLDEDFQKQCAEETVRGVCKYFGVTYVPQVDDTYLDIAAELLLIKESIEDLIDKL